MGYRMRQSVPLATLGLMVLLLAGCGEMNDSTAQAKSPTQAMEGSHMAGAPESAKTMEGGHMASAPQPAKGEMAAPAAPNQIVIDNFTFNPPTLTIAAGTQVTWVNHDDVPHTVTHSVKPRLFDSGTMDTDDQYAHKFTTPGTYDYFCALHPRMTGKIIVK
jgi:plastocyanin